MNIPADLMPYLDEEGRVTRWPSRRNRARIQPLLLTYFASKFEMNRDYTEREVNELLEQVHTFNDAALVRRELFEARLLDRERDGSRYWRVK